MLKNYLFTGFRSLKKHFTYSLINVTGLGLGLATCLLLVVWIRHELSFDRFHANAERLYRGSMEYSFGGTTSRTSVSPTALLPTMQKNFPEVENGVRINPAWSPFIVRRDEKVFQESRFYFADSTFFQVLSFKLLQGNPDQALKAPNSVVLTESMARKYFGNEDPIGKVLLVNNKVDYTVTGIMEDVPDNSIYQFDFMASFSSLSAAKEQIWWSANYQTILLLSPGADINLLRDKTNEIVKKALASELTGAGDYVVYNFMPLTDIYLHSDVDEGEVVGSITYIYIFGAIAMLVLIIACINYINLATAKATDRAKEVGVRKVVGALRTQLIFQFIGESILITFLGFCFGFLLAQVTLPLFNTITGKAFSALDLMDPAFLATCLASALVIALAAGVYPALAITAFRPVSVLKGNFKSSGRGVWLRQSLVVFQFSISIILMVATFVVLKQLNFIQQKNLGYDKANVIVLPIDRKTEELYDQLRTEFMRSGKVQSMGRATESPTKIKAGYGLTPEGSERGIITTAMAIDKEFISTLDMKIIAGRSFLESDFLRMKTDTVCSYILNESALKELGISKEKAVGTRVRLNRPGEVVGVVENFHFSSLHQTISPLVLFTENDQLNKIFVRLNPGDVRQSLAVLKATYSNLLPHRPFEYEFMDQQYARLYDKEQRMGEVSIVFATLTILIACLGLLGLVAFAAAQKTKEIGIRKVLGASPAQIVVLITRDYSKLVVLAMIIGLPTSYWIVEKWWLSDFAYRTTLGIAPFALAALTCLVIAFTTASYQAIKAAWIDPAETLRTE